MSRPSDFTKDCDAEIRTRLIREKLASGEIWFDFDGKNCEGPCEGWDGEDRRCQCGNRRVLWELSDDREFIFAVAW